MEEAYRQARKRGEQGRRRAISQSEHPYLTDLDSLVAQLPLGQRENVGLRDIPLEMVVGTGKLQLATGQHPGAMKDAVCSPGGTTIVGVAELERKGFRGAVIDAVDAIQNKK